MIEKIDIAKMAKEENVLIAEIFQVFNVQAKIASLEEAKKIYHKTDNMDNIGLSDEYDKEAIKEMEKIYGITIGSISYNDIHFLRQRIKREVLEWWIVNCSSLDDIKEVYDRIDGDNFLKKKAALKWYNLCDNVEKIKEFYDFFSDNALFGLSELAEIGISKNVFLKKWNDFCCEYLAKATTPEQIRYILKDTPLSYDKRDEDLVYNSYEVSESLVHDHGGSSPARTLAIQKLAEFYKK